MKYIFITLALVVILSSCQKAFAPIQNSGGTSTGNQVQNPLSEISLSEVSEATGISPKELGELMDTEIPLLTSSGFTIEARGTEPFWYFTASGSTLIWQAPGDIDIETETLTGVTLTSSGTSYSISGVGISADINLGTCSDGMSDLVYDYSASVTKGVTNFNGCANVD